MVHTADDVSSSLDIPPSLIRESEGLNVVIGASRALGRAVAEALVKDSLRVKAVLLDPSGLDSPFPDGVETVVANPMRPGGLAEACRGAYAIYDCFEPRFARWAELMGQVTENLILASIETGATLVLASHLVHSELDHSRLEKEMIAAHQSQLTRTVSVRVPQLYGPRVVNGLWQHIFESVIRGNKAHWMGNPEVPRSFLYVNDAAAAMVLLGRSLWAQGRLWTLPGPAPLTGRQFVEMAYLAAGREPQVGQWGREIVLTGSLLASESKGLLALPYDYYSPFVLDGSEFEAAFPSWKYTPHNEAITETLGWFRTHLAVGAPKTGWVSTRMS